MATYDAPQDFESELERVKRAREEIALLRKRTANREIPEGSMVGKHYVAPHWTQSLLQPAAENFSSGLREGMTNQREGVLNKAMQAEQERWMQQRPQTQAPVELAGPQEEATPFGETPQPMMSRTVRPSQQDQLAWAQQGTTNPLTKAIAAKFGEDALIHEPVREAAREQADKTREDTQKERRQAAVLTQALAREKIAEQAKVDREKIAEKAIADKRHADVLAEGIASRAQSAREAAQLRTDREREKAEGKAATETSVQAKERQRLELEMQNLYDRNGALGEAEILVPKSTGSRTGAAVDEAMKMTPWSFAGADAGNALKSLEGRLIAGGPKYGGAASNQDVKDYKAAVGDLANTKLSVDARMAALDTVKRLGAEDLIRKRNQVIEYNARAAQHGLPTIKVPDLPPALPPKAGAVPGAAPAAPIVPERRQADRRAVTGTIGGQPSDPESVPPPRPGNVPTFQAPPGMAEGEAERVRILLNEYHKGPAPARSPEDAARAAESDRAALRAELARLGINADTGQVDPSVRARSNAPQTPGRKRYNPATGNLE